MIHYFAEATNAAAQCSDDGWPAAFMILFMLLGVAAIIWASSR